VVDGVECNQEVRKIIRIVVFFFVLCYISIIALLCTINVWSLQIHSNSSLRSVSIVFRPRNIISFALFKNIYCIVFINNFYISLFPIILIFLNVHYIIKDIMFLTHLSYISIEVRMQVITTPPRKSAPHFIK